MFFSAFLGTEPEAVPSADDSSGTRTLRGRCSLWRGTLQPPDSEDHPGRDGVEISGCQLKSEELSFVRALLQFSWSLRIKRPANDCVLQQVMLAKQASPLSLGILALKREWREGEGGGAPEGRRCNLRTWHSLQEGDSSRPDHCAKACQDHQKLQIGLPPSLKWLFRHLSSGSSASCRQAPLDPGLSKCTSMGSACHACEFRESEQRCELWEEQSRAQSRAERGAAEPSTSESGFFRRARLRSPRAAMPR